MNITLPVPVDRDTAKLVGRMTGIVGRENVLTATAELATYECDGFTIAKTKPDVVVFPLTTAHIVSIVKACNDLDVPFMARGAGTSLAGGCVPVGGGVMIALARMKTIHEVNVRDRYAVVDPGVVNVWLTNTLKPHGYHYAPIPAARGRVPSAATWPPTAAGRTRSSTASPPTTCSASRLVLPERRDSIALGGPMEDCAGLRPASASSIGSRGHLRPGVRSATLRLVREPERRGARCSACSRPSTAATNAVSGIIGSWNHPGGAGD